MMNCKLLFLASFAFLLVSASAMADNAIYNFGTMQKENKVSGEPGETVVTKLYFYNLWGNRITHSKLYVVEKPEGWSVGIEPALHNVTLNVTGVIVTTEENVYAEPIKNVSALPASVPEGIEYITAPGIGGLFPAKVVRVAITIPSGAPLWSQHKVKITAIANWFGEAGSVALQQQRDFDYAVSVVTRQYTEQIVQPGKAETAPLVAALAIGILAIAVFYYKRRKISKHGFRKK